MSTGAVPTPVTIRAAVPSDMPSLVGLLRRAFDSDPVITWLLRQDGRRAAAMDWYFRLSLRMSMPLGHVFVAGATEGMAAWAPPDRWGEGRLRHVWELPGFLRAIGIRRVPAIMPAVMALEARHPRRPHYYLFEIAVDPGSQGRGIGSALLRHVLDECDRRNVPAYLESSNPRNNLLYERLGFQITERHPLGGDGPPVWLMWRDPMS